MQFEDVRVSNERQCDVDLCTAAGRGKVEVLSRLLDGGGDVLCWGAAYRQFGSRLPLIHLFGVSPDNWQSEPTHSATMVRGHRLALSAHDLCIRRLDGTLRCRGGNFYGVLGLPMTLGGQLAEMLASARTLDNWGNAADILQFGTRVGCVRQTDATVRCAGNPNPGLLGNNFINNPTGVPVEPIGLGPVRQLVVAHDHVCALQVDGKLMCWGSNNFGLFGLGNRNGDAQCWNNTAHTYIDREGNEVFQPGTQCYQVPTEGTLPEGTVYLASGVGSLCGVTSEGRIWCRGLILSGRDQTIDDQIEQLRWVEVPAP